MGATSIPARRRGLRLLAILHARLLFQRPEIDIIALILLTTVAGLVGFGLVLSQAIEEMFDRSGDPSTLIVLARNGNGEAESFISPEAAAGLRTLLSAQNMSGLESDEQLVISASVQDGPAVKFLTIRGIADETAMAGRRIVEGRMFRRGLNEVIVGRAAQLVFPSYSVGSQITLARRSWVISGIFEMGGDVRESEAVGDIAQVRTRYGAPDVINSIRLRTDPSRRERIIAAVENDDTLELTAQHEQAFFERQSRSTVNSVKRLQLLIMGLVIPTALLGLLSLQRIQQAGMLAELRMLSFIGFQQRDIQLSMLARSLLVGLLASMTAAIVFHSAVTGKSIEFDLGLQSVGLRFAATGWTFLAMALVACGVAATAGLAARSAGRMYE